MDGTRATLRLYDADIPFPLERGVSIAPPLAIHRPTPDASVLANRELLRPMDHPRVVHGLVPFTSAWFDELEHKRYQRHGIWLPAALEFGRHPGESVLLLGPGLGTDAVTYARTGSPVTVGVTDADHPDLIRHNLDRHALPARIVDVSTPKLPFADGTFDIVTWNALHDAEPPNPDRIVELFRVLKAGGKVIGLFPAKFDAGYWQDLILPLQWLYWRRPPDPTTGPKTTAKQLRRAFTGFTTLKVSKRHLRRSELPHLWRVVPLTLLQRVLGRVLVFKALKPLSARTGICIPLAA